MNAGHHIAVGDYLYAESSWGPDGNHVRYYSVARRQVLKLTPKTIVLGPEQEIEWRCHTPPRTPTTDYFGDAWGWTPARGNNGEERVSREKLNRIGGASIGGRFFTTTQPNIPAEVVPLTEIERRQREKWTEHRQFCMARGFPADFDIEQRVADYVNAAREYRMGAA